MDLSKELQLGKAGEHLVCYDLIMKGYVAFLAAEGLPYDIIIDINGKLKTMQVKSTEKSREYVVNTKSYGEHYFFNIRNGGDVSAVEVNESCDYYAFVVINDEKIAYLNKKSLISSKNNSLLKQVIMFKSKDIFYPNSRKSKFIEDFSNFNLKKAKIRNIHGVLGNAGQHLVCFNLIKNGFNAFLADQGLPFDIVIEQQGNCKTMQVKSISKVIDATKSKDVYMFSLRKHCKKNKKSIALDVVCDFYTFVALDRKVISYFSKKDMKSNKTGKLKQTLQIKTREIEYVDKRIYSNGKRRTSYGMYMEDFNKFNF